jgi:hypothetical protein
MFDRFTFGGVHVTDAQRPQLIAAILKGDAVEFRQVLQESPPPDDLFRLYGVFTMTQEGMTPIMVDRNGHPFGGPEAVIPAGTPIDMLNVKYASNKVTVTIGDRVYKADIEIPGLS